MAQSSSKKIVAVPVVNFATDQKYQKLLTILRGEIAAGNERVQRYVNFEKVRINWNIGRQIDRVVLKGKDRLPNGFRARLADDLNMSESHISATIRFYRAYPKLPVHSPLSWTHYIYLLKIDDPAKRKALEGRIVKENLQTPELRLLMSNPAAELPAHPSNAPAVRRGRIYTYRVLNVRPIAGDQFATLDCGFAINLAKMCEDKAYTNLCYSEKLNKVYHLRQSQLITPEDLHTYKATVERYIDADTLLVNVDVGFDISSRQKLRFRGVDTPELGTAAGNRAKKFVEDRLKACAFVVVKTYKSDKYDRYLVDVFYKAGETDPQKVADEGTHLNAELLAAGLAQPWR